MKNRKYDQDPVKTTPQNVEEANEALYYCNMNLPEADYTLWHDNQGNEDDFL